MYRGFEALLVGRSAMDSLVITPRICGICSVSHLTAAAMALDEVTQTRIPDNAQRLRHVALMAEQLQSDIRQSILMYMVDFANPGYQDRTWFAEAVQRYAPLQGESVVETVRETKKLPEIIAILGGQWPHTSFMVPGGVVLPAKASAIRQCRCILDGFRSWYERRILGDTLEAWHEATDPLSWIEETPQRRQSDLGFFIRVALQLGLDRIGAAHGSFLSFAGWMPPGEVQPDNDKGSPLLTRAGFYRNGVAEPLDPDRISEHVACSWYKEYKGGLHPFKGRTQPQPPVPGQENEKYSWAKAPRYGKHAPETGPLAEALLAEHPLFRSLVKQGGGSAFVRQLARIVRPALLIPILDETLQTLENQPDGSVYQKPEPLHTGKGAGMIQAARGALGHWVRLRNGLIDHYQIITPTAWNGSPRDGTGLRGPWEQALIGTSVRDPANPLEAGHVIRSFDPCLVCTVHTVRRERDPLSWRLG